MTEPVKREEWREWMEEFQAEPDRSCAILAAAFLDEQLRALLEAFLVDDPKRVSELFGGSAPLSTFASRISVSYALGFLSPDEARDLDLVRKVRNEFAHALHGTSFSSPGVASRCAEMTRCNLMGQFLDLAHPRNRFVLTVVFLAQWIAMRRLEIRETRRRVHGDVQWKRGEVSGRRDR